MTYNLNLELESGRIYGALIRVISRLTGRGVGLFLVRSGKWLGFFITVRIWREYLNSTPFSAESSCKLWMVLLTAAVCRRRRTALSIGRTWAAAERAHCDVCCYVTCGRRWTKTRPRGEARRGGRSADGRRQTDRERATPPRSTTQSRLSKPRPGRPAVM